MKGKIIVLEGLDGSGKKTQTKLLIERMRREKIPVETFSFPRYGTPTGKKIEKYLRGEYGSLESLDPNFVIKLYADDRLSVKRKILNLLSEGKNLVFDRWIESNMAHQAAKFKEKERNKIIKQIKKLEIEEYGLPQADLVIYLSLPVKLAMEAMDKEGRKKDIHEIDKEYLSKVNEVYKYLAKNEPNWIEIKCVKKNKRLSKEEVHEKIWSAVKLLLKS